MGTRSPREGIEGADWLHLGDDEQVLWIGRPSRVTIAAEIAGGLILATIGIALTVAIGPAIEARDLPGWIQYLPLVLTLIGLLVAGLVYLNWLRLLYVITDEEIYVKYGLVSRDVTQVRLGRVQNTTFEQSVLERFLRFGDVRVYTAGDGTEDLTLHHVPHPQAITGLLTEALSEESGRLRRQGL